MDPIESNFGLGSIRARSRTSHIMINEMSTHFVLCRVK